MNIVEFLEKEMSVYCEKGIGFISFQPINTISNIGFFIAAYFAYRYIREYRIKSGSIQLLPFSLLVMGIASMFWHGMPHLVTGFADTLSIVFFVLVSFSFLLSKLLSKRSFVWRILLVMIAVEIPFIFGLLPSFNGLLAYLIVLIFGLFILFGIVNKYKDLLLQTTVIITLFIIALLFRTIDHAICSAFPLGTHFIWHILNVVVFYLSVCFFVALEEKK